MSGATAHAHDSHPYRRERKRIAELEDEVERLRDEIESIHFLARQDTEHRGRGTLTTRLWKVERLATRALKGAEVDHE